MYLRARDYGLRGLAVNHASIDNIRLEPETSVSTMTVDDVPLLYWTAA
ncbi:MAG: TRAP transporter TatT component family protein, partial [Gammaproteobacteria bacterium]